MDRLLIKLTSAYFLILICFLGCKNGVKTLDINSKGDFEALELKKLEIGNQKFSEGYAEQASVKVTYKNDTYDEFILKSKNNVITE